MKKTNQRNEFEVTMNKEHLGQSVQQYLRGYGYFSEETEDQPELISIELLGNNQVKFLWKT